MNTEQRLDKLEAELARHRRYNKGLVAALVAKAVGVFILAVAAMAIGYFWPSKDAVEVIEEIRTQRIVLVDENGNSRLHLEVGENGSQVLVLDENGTPQAQLNVNENGPELYMLSGNPPAGSGYR